MLSRAQYIEGLTHPDFFVRSGVFELFANERDQGLDVSAAVLTSIERFGLHEAFRFPHQICGFALDKSTAERALLLVARPDIGPDAYELPEWIGRRAPIDLVREHFADLTASKEGRPVMGPQSARQTERRLEAAALSIADCRRRLEELPFVAAASEEFPAALLHEADLLGERLAEDPQSREELADHVRDWLAFDFDCAFSPQHWLSGIAIRLAGLLKLEDLTARIIEHLDVDLDWWNDAVTDALESMRSPRVMETCARLYPSLEWHARIYTCSVFETYRVPEIEPALTALLETEDDDPLRADLANSIALTGSPSAQQLARSIYWEDPKDPERLMIGETLYYQSILQGVTHPDLVHWRTRMERSRRLVADPTAALSQFPSPSLSSGASLPHRNSTPTIGRNELCPCGSSKKFKKCCLRP